MMKRWTIPVVTALVLLTLAAVLNHWQKGTVMARAKNCDRKFYNEIVVREIRSTPLEMFLPSDSACYQCEFHRPGWKRAWSYQTYSGESFKATRSRIVWANEREATVFLDDLSIFKCVDGLWTRP